MLDVVDINLFARILVFDSFYQVLYETYNFCFWISLSEIGEESEAAFISQPMFHDEETVFLFFLMA
jgi:hypothetical protein